MAGGQQITSGQGTLTYNEVSEDALSGEEATSALETPGQNRLVFLRSRKTGTGNAQQALTGASLTGTQGSLTRAKSFALTGRVATFAQGTLVYQGRATIGWNANTESDLAGYRVYHGTASGVYTEFVTLGLVTTYQWSGLTGGQTHYFAVAAFDTTGNESALSAQVSKAY